MRRFVVLSALVAMLTYAASVWAFGFGNIRVNSTLNEPLDATLDLVSLSAAERHSLSVGVAGPDMFQRFGIERSALADELRVERRSAPGSNHVVVHLTTRRPVREPFLRFLIEASTDSGKALREYTVLLDPPGHSPTQTAAAPAPAAPSMRRSQPVARASRRAPASRRASVSPNTYSVHSGDTLSRIAARTKRPGTTQDQRQVAIFRANPDAFGGNMDMLMKGARLTIPAADRIAAIDTGEARAEILAQRRAAEPAPADNDSKVAAAGAESEMRMSASLGTETPATTGATLRLEPPSGDYADKGALFGRLVEPDFKSARSRISESAARAVGALTMAGRAEAVELDDLVQLKPNDAGPRVNAGKQNQVGGDNAEVVDADTRAESGGEAGSTGAAADNASRPLPAADTDVAGSAGFDLLKPSTLLLILALILLVALLLVWNRRRQYKPVPLDFGPEENVDDQGPNAPSREAPVPAMAATPASEPGEPARQTTMPAPEKPVIAASARVQNADRQMKIGLFDQARSTLEAGLEQTPEDAGLQDKLLELDYLSGDSAAFASDVERFDDALAGNGVRWAGVAAMGRLLLPDDPRFAASGHKSASRVESPATDWSVRVPAPADHAQQEHGAKDVAQYDTDSDPKPATLSAPAGPSAFEEPTAARESADDKISQETSGAPSDTVFDVSDYEQADSLDSSKASETPSTFESQMSVAPDTGLELPAESKPQSPSDAGSELEFEAPVAAQTRPKPASDTPNEPGDENGLALDTRGYDWQPQEVAAGNERQHDRSDEPGLAFELDTSRYPENSDTPEAPESKQASAEVDVEEVDIHANSQNALHEEAQELPPLDISEFDLDGDNDASASDEQNMDETDDESDSVAIRLELARMYVDMEDEGAARELLDEAIAEGTQPQRREAEKMLAAM